MSQRIFASKPIVLGSIVCAVTLVGAMPRDASATNPAGTDGVAVDTCYRQTSVTYESVDGAAHPSLRPGDATVTHWSIAKDGSGEFTSTIPPQPFNPATADPRWLPLVGLPPRPDDPAQASEWARRFDRVWKYEPTGDMCPTDKHALIISNDIWSGIVDKGSYTNYDQAYSDVIVPSLVASCPSNAAVVLWTGVGNSGLMQNGLAADEADLSGMYAWWEVLSPTDRVPIIPVSGRGFAHAGNDVFIKTSYNASNGILTMSWYNVTTATAIATVSMHDIIWSEPSPSHAGVVSDAYDGKQVEFIVERPTVGVPVPLIHYNDHEWQLATAHSGSTSFIYANAVPHYEVDMWQSNVPLSYIPDHVTHPPSNWTMHWHACS